MLYEVDDDYDPRKEVEIPEDIKELNQKWQKLMSEFKKPLPQAKPGEVWVQTEKIFDMQDFI